MHGGARAFIDNPSLCLSSSAVIDLNGRFFGGRVVKASFFSEERFSSYDLAP